MRKLFFTLALLSIWSIQKTAFAQDSNGPSPIGTLDTTGYSYDVLVDSSLTHDDPVKMQFRTVQAAYAAAPAGAITKPTVIGIKPDVYQITGTATTPGLTVTKNYITLLGLTNNHRNVVLADNRGNKQGAGVGAGSNNGYVIVVNATGFSAINLTLLNYCNVDYEYPGNRAKNLTKRSNVITQAVALQASGDKHVYDHVALLSRLDTMFLLTNRSYFKNVYIEGTDDFIGGGSISVWENCYIYFPVGGGVPSTSGVTFINTTFAANDSFQFYKSSPPNPVALINCTFPLLPSTARISWIRGAAPIRPNYYSLTYHTKYSDGRPAVIADNSVGAPGYLAGRELSDKEALAFNPWNLLRATPTGVADDWDPAGVKDTYAAQGSLIFKMTLTNGSPSIITGRPGATISVTAYPSRAPDSTITWTTSSKLVQLSRLTGSSITVTAQNPTDVAQYVQIKASAANGFHLTAWVYAQPAYIDPPKIISGPAIEPPRNGSVTIAYRLNLAPNCVDQSLITWNICDDASCDNPRSVAISRGNLSLTTLPLVPGYIGKYLQVSIQPRADISDPGPAVTAIAAKPILASDIETTTVSPNFRNFDTTPNGAYVSGMWTVNGTWRSVAGDTFVNGYGVRAGSQGASLLYQQDAPYGDMQTDVVMSPEKTAGQGFGSPGSGADDVLNTTPPQYQQKAEIYIKYDPRSKNGYALRWWRTTQSATDCMFQLYRIVNGAGSPISSQQVLTGVFKPDTYITLKISGTTFTVNAHNTMDTDTLFLQATINPNPYGGAGVYWSGTTPSGNSNVYSLFQISYPGAAKLSTTATVARLSNGGRQKKSSFADLTKLFAEWRAFLRPGLIDGVPDYTARAMSAQHRGLPAFQRRLADIATSDWPINEQVDWHIVRAEMNGLDFDHRTLRPWANNPGFYVTVFFDQSDQPAREGPHAYGAVEVWKYTFPLSAEHAAEMDAAIRIIPKLLEQARRNLVGKSSDLWIYGTKDVREQSDSLARLATMVAGAPAELKSDVARAKEATDRFVEWLEAQIPSKTAPSGIGVENYDWYLKNVQLVPYTWQEEVALMESELARAHAFLALEEEKNKGLPQPAVVASDTEYTQRFNAGVDEYMSFLKDREILTIKDYMAPALRAQIGKFNPGPRDFFGEIDYRDPVVMRTHGYHWFDLAQMEHEPHTDQIRRGPLLYNIFNTRTEGHATGWEELMMQAGMFEARPRTRELIYILIAERAARALGELRMMSGEFTLEQAAEFTSRNTPRGWLSLKGNLVRSEQHLYLQQPGYGTSYLVGKKQLEMLLAARKIQLGDSFLMKQFMDSFNAAGLAPASLLRWELTGQMPNDVKRMLASH